MSHQNIKWTLHVCRNDTILWVVENEKYELLQFSSEVKIVEKLDSNLKRENSDSVQDECEDLYAGAGNCTGCPVPDTCLVNTLETGLNIATILLAILGTEQQLHRTALLFSVPRHPRELCVGVRVVSLRLHQVRQPADHACLHGHQVTMGLLLLLIEVPTCQLPHTKSYPCIYHRVGQNI